MIKEKKVSLTKYINECKDRLKLPVSEKHVGHEKQFHEFLRNEIAKVQAKLDAAALDEKK